MKTFLYKLIEDIKLDSNLYIFCKIQILNNEINILVNSDIPTSILSSLSSELKSYKNILLVCRTEKEPHYGTNYPPKNIINYLKKELRDIRIFYQNPWPDKVPTFSKNKTVIRFGYDDGCDFDKLTLNKKLKYNYKDGEYFYLVNSNKITELKSKNYLV